MAAASLASDTGRKSAGTMRQPSASRDLILLRRRIEEIVKARCDVGIVPPGPRTVRARVGRLLIGTVKRALFWLLPQLDRVHSAIAEAAQQQAGLLEELAAEQRTLDGRLQKIDQHLQNVRAESPRRLYEMERGWKGVRESLREVSDSVRELDYRMNSQEQRMPFQMEQLRNQMAADAFPKRSSLADSRDGRDYGSERKSLESIVRILEYRGLGNTEMPVLDVGSGDGILLGLLEAAGFSATGVEENHVLAATGIAKGLRLVGADPFIYLSSLPSCCLGAVTALASISDLPFPQLTTLLDEALRVLKPGGVVILVGPDDPCGKRSPGLMLSKVAHFRGFEEADIMCLQSGEELFLASKPRTVTGDAGQP